MEVVDGTTTNKKLLEIASNQVDQITVRQAKEIMFTGMLQGGKPVDKESLVQLSTFVDDATKDIKFSVNNTLDRRLGEEDKKLLASQSEEVKQKLTEQFLKELPLKTDETQKRLIKEATFEALEPIRKEIAGRNPAYKEAREQINKGLDNKISQSKEKLSIYIEANSDKLDQDAKESIPYLKKDMSSDERARRSEALIQLKKKEVIATFLEEVAKRSGLTHKKDKISEHLVDDLMKMDLKKLQDPKLLERVSKDLKNIKTLSNKYIGSTVTSKSLRTIAENIDSDHKQALSIKDRLLHYRNKIGSQVGIFNKASHNKDIQR